MKKMKFLLPIVAIMFAVAGVFATEKNSLSPTLSIIDNTLINASSCPKDGTCDTSVPTVLCRLASGSWLNVRVSATVCPSSQVWGKFTRSLKHQYFARLACDTT